MFKKIKSIVSKKSRVNSGGKKSAQKIAKKLIVANWKMNPENLHDAKKIFSDLKKKNLKLNKSVAVICPPNIFLGILANEYRGDKFVFGAQDVSLATESESTGEVSAEILKNLGVKYAIVGHSERRAIGETSEIVSQKIRIALQSGITPILCVGETERDINGKYLRFIQEQLHNSLSGIDEKQITKIIIAYEPVWAIGHGHNAISGNDLHQMNIFIKKILTEIYDRKIAMKVPVLYGGSVDSENVLDILKNGEVSGLLIGRASLNPHVFGDVLKVIEA